MTGGGLAILSALIGRISGERYLDARIQIWLAASVGIFIGLAILSVGSRHREEEEPRRENKADEMKSSDTPLIEGGDTPPQRDRDGAKAGDGSGH